MDIGWFTLFFSAFTAAVGFFGNMFYERKKALRDKATEERRTIYSDFIEIMVDRFHSQNNTEIGTDADFSKRMFEFYKDYLLYASPDVINAVGEYQQFAILQGNLPLEKQDLKTYYLKYAKVIYEMREDLGLSIKELGSHGQHIFKTMLVDYTTIFSESSPDKKILPSNIEGGTV